MTDFTPLLQDVDDEPQGCCSDCTLQYGRARSEHISRLRCPTCDYPFGETFEAVRVIAFSLQKPRAGIFYNVYSQKVCYVWLQVIRDGIDLGVEPYSKVAVFGTTPEWLDHEISNSGWDSVLSPQWRGGAFDTSDFDGTWNNWALEEGLCPGQQFLVEMKPPTWHKCSYEYEEWDVEYHYDFVMRAPRSPAQLAKRWSDWIRRCGLNRRAVRAAHAKLAHKRSHDVKAMYLTYERWSTSNVSSDWWPDLDGHLVELRSRHGGWILASGRSPTHTEQYARLKLEITPSRALALEALLDEVRKRHPHLDPEAIRKLDSR